MVNEEIVGLRVIRLRDPNDRVRVGLVTADEIGVLDTDDALATLEADDLPRPVRRIPLLDPQTCRPPDSWKPLMPLIAQETWAAGVTYERSREARVHESRVKDVYDLVYEAERPELFLKATASRWTVPEPELAVALGSDRKPLAVTIGNDVSSRDIEGANPLYLPQAKIYAGACALGPALLVPVDWSVPFDIHLRIEDANHETIFTASTSTASMRRSIAELVEFLCRDSPVPPGTVLLTGTGIVPPDDLTLLPGHCVEISIAGIGTLRNTVAAAATPEQRQEETAHA